MKHISSAAKNAAKNATVLAGTIAPQAKQPASRDRNAESIAMSCGLIGSAVAECASVTRSAQAESLLIVDGIIRESVTSGLTVAMLKAKQPCYLAFVDAIGESLATGTRDNYLSRIRSFVTALLTGDKTAELDLYGNIKAKANRAAQIPGTRAPVEDGEDGADDAQQAKQSAPMVSNKEGAAALVEMLTNWVNKNAADGALFHLLGLARDLNAEAAKCMASAKA